MPFILYPKPSPPPMILKVIEKKFFGGKIIDFLGGNVACKLPLIPEIGYPLSTCRRGLLTPWVLHTYVAEIFVFPYEYYAHYDYSGIKVDKFFTMIILMLKK